ncbi:hypothetical protein ACFV3O_20490, partial [Streptomyces albidoflavus]
ASDWLQGRASGIRVVAGSRPGIRIAAPAGGAQYADPHPRPTPPHRPAARPTAGHRRKRIDLTTPSCPRLSVAAC